MVPNINLYPYNEVTTCSKSCNSKRRATSRSSADAPSGAPGYDESNGVDDDDIGSARSSDVEDGEDVVGVGEDAGDDRRAARKAAKRTVKAAKRAKREGGGETTDGQKQCGGCNKSVDLLVRCQTDETRAWRMLCGKCWSDASGGVADGDAQHPHYRYGGLWKNRRASKHVSTTPPELEKLAALELR